MDSYFSMRAKSFAKSASLFVSSRSRTIENIRCMRSANRVISFRASSTDNSGVCMMPLLMKRRRESSSSSRLFIFIILHTAFSICGMNHIRMNVLHTLKAVWNMASTIDSFCAPACPSAGS